MDSNQNDPELDTIRKERLNKIMSQTPAISEPVKLTSDSFDEFIENTPIVLVDFWAEWCGPCRMVSPILEDLAKKYEGKVWIGKVNVDNYQGLAMKFGANSIPTFWAFKEGVPVGRFVGAYPREAFENIFKQLVDLDMDEVRRKQAEAETQN